MAFEVVEAYEDAIFVMRHAQQTRIRALSEEIDQAKIQLFALDKKTSFDYRIEQANKIMEKAQHLKSIGGSDESFNTLKEYINNVGWEKAYSMQTGEQDGSAVGGDGPSASLEAVAEKPVIETLAIAESDEDHQRAEVLKFQQREQERKAQMIRDLIAKNQRLSALRSASAPCLDPKALLDYQAAAMEAMTDWLACEGLAEANTYIKDINSAVDDSKKQCVRGLTQFLMEDNIQAIDSLKGYIKHLPDNCVALAVMRKNAPQLVTLLTHGQFSINSIHIKNGKQLSLLEYAYVHGDLDCFKILLKHGASPMVLNEAGLPLAYLVLKSRPNQFYDALMQVHSTKPFFRKLIQSLTQCLQKNGLEEAQRGEVERDILHYEKLLGGTNQVRISKLEYEKIRASRYTKA